LKGGGDLAEAGRLRQAERHNGYDHRKASRQFGRTPIWRSRGQNRKGDFPSGGGYFGNS
jgi:hypothetical protein